MTEHDEPLPEGEESPPRGVGTMALVRWALIIVMAAVAIASVLYATGLLTTERSSTAAVQYYCPMHPSVVQDHPGECPICSMTLVPRASSAAASPHAAAGQESGSPHVTVGPDASSAHAGHRHEPSDPFYCPMHPEETGVSSDERCPICGMRLEPRTASTPSVAPKAGVAPPSGVSGLAGVELPPERIQLIGLRTARVTRRPLTPEVRTVGFVTADESRLAQIHTRFAGWIEELRVAQTGAQVRRDDVLATIYSPTLVSTQQELLTARRFSQTGSRGGETSGGAIDLVGAARRRLELLGIGPEEIRALERRGAPLRALPVRSPVDGYVTERAVVRGSYVETGAKLFAIVDLTTVWVLADVYEQDLARVENGRPAELNLAAYPGKTFAGRVEFTYPTLDAGSRTLKVRLAFDNPGLVLKPGMYGNVRVALPTTTELIVPREALVDTGEAQYVFLAFEGGRFEPRRVQVGATAGDEIVVTEGLSEGDTVVTTANFLLDSESRLRAAIEGESRAGGSPASVEASTCDRDIDRSLYPEKYAQCRACEVQHRGMGTMEDDCKSAIPKPWRAAGLRSGALGHAGNSA